jgi:phosphoribosylamine--glycine ligase
MGVICPVDDVDRALMARIEREIIVPTLVGMRAEGAPFTGVLFAGVMVDEHGAPLLLEHNVRFGDPECEALMELVATDVGELLASAARGELDPAAARVHEGKYAAVVILAAEGYPEGPRKGDVISGVERAEALGATVHHAGTARDASGALVTAGGRVLAVTGAGATLGEARAQAYAGCEAIHFAGKHFRRDIGETVGATPTQPTSP